MLKFYKFDRAFRAVTNFKSLKLRLTLSSAILSICVLCVISSLLSRSAQDAVQREAHRHAVEVSSYLSEAIAESVASNDRMQVHLLVQSLLNNGVYSCSVVRSDGTSLFAQRSELDEETLYAALDRESLSGVILGTVKGNDHNFLQAAKTIQFGKVPVGMLHLWLDRTEVEKRIREVSAFIYPVFILGFAMMVALGMMLLHTPFRTLKRLTAVAQDIGAGDLSVRVPVEGSDEVAAFCRTFNRMTDGLLQVRRQLDREHLQTIEAMISSVEAKDRYTQGHCLRVQEYARTIMNRLGRLTPDERNDISTAALLHDIGKIGIPDELLAKPTGLSPQEVEAIRSHVIIGENILRNLDSMKEIARWVRHHHERWDGAGYPDGLAGKAIPLPSRIIAVADTVDALLSKRPYRDAQTPEEAVATLRAERGHQFDPEIVDCILPFFERELEGASELETTR